MTDKNTTAAMEQVGKQPVQMSLPFGRVYGDIAIKEAIRGVKAITKELIRFGADKRQVTLLMNAISEEHPIVMEAIDLMDEKLMGDD